MKETEVLKRLGIRNKNKLLSLLHRSNISRCIWQRTNYYKLVPTIPKLVERIKTLELTESITPIDINKEITLNRYRRDKGNLQRKNRYVGWKVKIPRRVLLKEDISDYYTTNDGIPHNNIVHRGHLLGKQFEKFLFESTSIEKGKIHFFDKNNIDNGKVRENRIYVRKGSKNTAIDSQAEIGDIEKLFEFRFGLTPFPKERVINYITDHDHWIEMKGNYETRSWYYEKFPEYTMELVDDPQNDELKAPVYALIHPNARTTWQILRLKYHQTILLEFSSHYIDEYRGISVQPKYNFLKLFDRINDIKFPSMYYYYLSNSVEIELMYLLKELMQQDGEAWRRHLSLIPVFYDDEERNVIEEYIEENKSDILEKIKKESEKVCLGYNYEGNEQHSKWDKEEIAVTKVVKNILNEYRERFLKEKTSYFGRHYVEAYIVSNNICYGKTIPFEVNITNTFLSGLIN